MKDSDKPKLVIALVVLALAGVVIAWQTGVFGGDSSKPPVIDPVKAKGGGPRTAPGAK